MSDLDALAAGFRYPGPGSLELLRSAADSVEDSSIRRSFRRFVDVIGSLGLEAWEEVHTRTLDLSPLFVPYVGYVIWEDSYRRGAFLADMQRVENEAGIDPLGELSDHLDPVLRYLAVTSDPLPGLVEVFPKALDRMVKALAKAEPDNPYRFLLEATRAVSMPVGGAV